MSEPHGHLHDLVRPPFTREHGHQASALLRVLALTWAVVFVDIIVDGLVALEGGARDERQQAIATQLEAPPDAALERAVDARSLQLKHQVYFPAAGMKLVSISCQRVITRCRTFSRSSG